MTDANEKAPQSPQDRDASPMTPTVSERIHQSNNIATATPSAGMLPVFEWYALECGLRVFPLRRFTKFPAVSEWQNVATTNMDTIRDWLAQDQLAGVGLLTGVANRLLVVDRDVRNGIDGFTALIEEQDVTGNVVPTTTRVTTPSFGTHLYLSLDEPCPSANGWMPGVDIKADGGYVVGANSAVAYSMTESWSSKSDPVYRSYDLVHSTISARQPAPEWLLSSVRTVGGRFGTGRGLSSQKAIRELSIEDVIREGIDEGARNETMHWLLCSWWATYGVDNPEAVVSFARIVWSSLPNRQTFPWSTVEYMLPRTRAKVREWDDERRASGSRLFRSAP